MEIINKVVKKEWTFEEIPIGSVFSVPTFSGDELFFIKINYNKGFCLHSEKEVDPFIKVSENKGFWLQIDEEVGIFDKKDKVTHHSEAKLIIE